MRYVNMKYARFIVACAFACCMPTMLLAVKVSFEGNSKPVITIQPESNTGLDKIYVVNNSSELSEIKIEGVSASVIVSQYGNLGGGYAEPMNVEYVDGAGIIANPQGNRGYIVEDAHSRYYFWIVDYSSNSFSVESISAAENQDCDNTQVEVSGRGEPIHYYSIDGRQCELSRDIEARYYTLEWNDSNLEYVQVSKIKTLSHLTNIISFTPPFYCNTTVEISGDRFLKQWGELSRAVSPAIRANGVSVHTSATHTNAVESTTEDPSNLINTESQGMGGSAPADIEFRAWGTDAVIHNEWQIASDPNFEYIDYRFNEQNLDYTFNEEGNYYVRFVGSNADGSCQAYGETYVVSIGASELRIPNAFTPNGDGVNDVWKVSYRSLTSFKCSIFDRYGNEITSFSDPSEGWDGKHNGKLVKPGVYFYVIEARGADGKKYKKGGDINIITTKRYATGGESEY